MAELPGQSDDLTHANPRVAPARWGSVPQPDPTVLTATAVAQAKEDLRRELSSMRELIDQRINGIANELHIIGVEVKQSPFEREKLRERLSSEANALAGSVHNEVRAINARLIQAPAEHDALRERLQTDIQVAVDNLRNLHMERFNAIQQQFDERDTRGEQEKKASKEALDAALLAQKESVSQQNDANTTAATKSETSFTKQIDQIGTLIATLEKSLTDRITELKERIDRGEGGQQGERHAVSERRLDAGQWIAVLAVVASVIYVVLVAIGKH